MREIKFRGLNRGNDQRWSGWHYGDLWHEKCGICVGSYEVDPATVGQFTGIKDISGADIYEGDIITFKDIETDEYARGAVLQSVDGTWRVVYEKLSVPLWGVRKTAIILSNIHDSPELLEADDARD